MKNFEDLFRYDDGALTLPGWTEFAGPAWVEDNSIGLSAGVNQLVYLTANQMDSLEHLARCSFRITEERSDVRVGLMVRAEVMDASPDIIHRCYLVTLDGEGRLSIFSILVSDPNPSAVVSCILTLDLSRGHTLIVKVRDYQQTQGDEGQAELLVYLDDEVSPRLTWTDSMPGRPEGQYVGFDIADASGNMAVTLGQFYAHVLRSGVIRNPQPVPELRNFTDLIYETGWRVNRGGNSQFDVTQMGNFLNYAMDEIYRYTHPWSWCERIYTWYTRAGRATYEMPAWMKWPGSLTDRSNARILTKNGWQELLILDPGGDVSASDPWRYAIIGFGDFGNPVIALQPEPDGEYTVIMPCYVKPVPMVEGTDIPMLPPEYNEALVLGAVKRAAQYTDAQKLYMAAANEFERILQQMRREDIARREEQKLTRLMTLNEQKRKEGSLANWPVRSMPYAQRGF